MTSAKDLIMGTGAPGFSFNNIGDTIVGQIINEPKAMQCKKFGTEELDFWPSGDPKMQTVFQVQTAWRNYEGINNPDRMSPDSGIRTIYLKGKHFEKATKIAILTARADWLDVGGWFKATYTGEDMSSKAPMKPKLFDVQYQPPRPQAAQQVMGGQDYGQGQRQYGQPVPQPPRPAEPVQNWQQPGWRPDPAPQAQPNPFGQSQIAVPSHHGQPETMPDWASSAPQSAPPMAQVSVPPVPPMSTIDLIRQSQGVTTVSGDPGQIQPVF